MTCQCQAGPFHAPGTNPRFAFSTLPISCPVGAWVEDGIRPPAPFSVDQTPHARFTLCRDFQKTTQAMLTGKVGKSKLKKLVALYPARCMSRRKHRQRVNEATWGDFRGKCIKNEPSPNFCVAFQIT